MTVQTGWVDPLLRRFPALGVTPLPLTTLPTPVTRADWLGPGVWVKHDELTAKGLGGNKLRKLAYLLADHDGRPVCAVGPTGSNWLAAVASVCSERAWPTQLHPFSMPDYPGAARKDAFIARVGCATPPTSVGNSLFRSWRSRLLGARVLPPGGSDALGTLAYTSAALELAEQIEAGMLPPPDRIYVAFGTGGCAVGLAVGLELAGLGGRVVAVRINDRAVANRIWAWQLAARCLRRLGLPARGARPLLARRLEWRHDELGGGYGRTTRRASAAVAMAARAGLVLEPIYTGKVLSALLRDISRGRVLRALFWNTYGPLPAP